MTFGIAAGFYVYQGSAAAGLAALYGGGIGLVATGLFIFRLIGASRPGSGVGGLFLGPIERMLVVGAGFALGFAILNLQPVPTLVGFAGVELAYLLVANVLRGSLNTAQSGKHNDE